MLFRYHQVPTLPPLAWCARVVSLAKFTSHIPLSELASRGGELSKFTSRPLVAYCDRGNKSGSAGSALSKLGFAEVYTLRGGVRAWTEAGLPLAKGA